MGLKTKLISAVALGTMLATSLLPASQPAEAALPGNAGTIAKAAISLHPVGRGIVTAASTVKTIQDNVSSATVDVRWEGERYEYDVPVGFTYRLPFEVTYSYEDWGLDNSFLEIYVVRDDYNVMYYKRIPETGYIDGAVSGKVQGAVEAGITQHLQNSEAKLQVWAVIYEDNTTDWRGNGGKHAAAPYHNGNPEMPRGQHHWVDGRGLQPFSIGDDDVTTSGRNYSPNEIRRRVHSILGGVEIQAIDHADRVIKTANPFFVEHRLGETHTRAVRPGETFDYNFSAEYHHRTDDEQIDLRPPDGRTQLEVRQFDDRTPWDLTLSPTGPLSFQMVKNGRASQPVVVTGLDTSSHPGETITYATQLQVRAHGENYVEREDPATGDKVTHVYGYSQMLRQSPTTQDLLPIPFSATSTDPAAAIQPEEPANRVGSDVPVATPTPTPPVRPVTGGDTSTTFTGTVGSPEPQPVDPPTAGPPTDEDDEPLPGLDDDEELPGIDDDEDEPLPGLDDDDLPGIDDHEDEPLPGLDDDEDDTPGNTGTPPSNGGGTVVVPPVYQPPVDDGPAPPGGAPVEDDYGTVIVPPVYQPPASADPIEVNPVVTDPIEIDPIEIVPGYGFPTDPPVYVPGPVLTDPIVPGYQLPTLPPVYQPAPVEPVGDPFNGWLLGI